MSSSNPLLQTVNYESDPVGRFIGVTDPLQHRTQFTPDPLDRVAQTTDALSHSTVTGFDPNGNRTSVQDANGHTHGYGYNARNDWAGYTDPLNHTETYGYDGDHNLISTVDRNNQTTGYSYDHLNRLTQVTFNDGSSIVYNYDAGNRIYSVVDSVNGTIGYQYDGLDRVLSVTTPKGTVAYTYYSNGLRQTMMVMGQPTISYGYDPGNRLTQITQPGGPSNNGLAQTANFQYDAANRLTQTTLPNGIKISYGYDNADELTAISYALGNGTVLGNLSYGYNAAGQRISVDGSWARMNKPAAVSGVVTDAANRLTGWNGMTLSYDNNGNLLSDGVNTYSWNARKQLTQISQGSTVIASFTYDALGRRQTKVVNGTATGYVYDGLNIVQELNGTTTNDSVATNVRANYLTGLGVDSRLAQFTGTASNYYLTDALGSTISLFNAAGSDVVDYTYDPYGNSTASATVANAFQYTGRENDGDGWDYYRARYYSPMFGRFASQDPIRMAGGVNFYAYVMGDPISSTDPNGLIGGTHFIPPSPIPKTHKACVQYCQGQRNQCVLTVGGISTALAYVTGGTSVAAEMAAASCFGGVAGSETYCNNWADRCFDQCPSN